MALGRLRNERPRARLAQYQALGACLAVLFVGIAPCGLKVSAAEKTLKNKQDAGAENALRAPRSHQQMIEHLESVAKQSARANPYTGDGVLRELHQRLAALGPDAPPLQRWRLLMGCGMNELRLGNNRRALELLHNAYKLTTSAAMNPQSATLSTYYLGVAYMRLGETENCCLRHTSQSCIVPIQQLGQHAKREGSTQAIKYFTEILENRPPRAPLALRSRWLLNVAYMTLGEYPEGVPAKFRLPPETFQSKIHFPRFKNVGPELGLETFNLCGGVIVDDFDGDDYLDVMTSTWDTQGQMRFFHNNRDGTFSDRTVAAGLTGLTGGLNMMQADYDNDGDIDVYILRGAWLREVGRHANSLLRNNGDGTFTDVTFGVGMGDAHYPTQAAGWADFDNDGDVDLYVGNEHSSTMTAPCQLYRNNGDGTFTNVAREAGVENFRFAKGVTWGDYDNDRYPDLYVTTYEDNRLYHNNGDGTFTDVAPRLGVVNPQQAFPTWFWDFNNDGALDLFVASYICGLEHIVQFHLSQPFDCEPPALYRGDGKGSFTNVAAEMGLARPMLPMGANFGDLDGDGYLDFYLGTGEPEYDSLMPNLMFLNNKGEGFVDVTMAGGFGHLQKGHAVAFADLDQDGDTDIYEQMGGALLGDKYVDSLYENPGFGNHWLTVKLVGVRSNRSALGARIRAEFTENGTKRTVYRFVGSGGSFGANPLRQTIGLGKATTVGELEIWWPSTDRRQLFKDIPADRIIQITEGNDQPVEIKLKSGRFGGQAAMH